MNDDEYLLFICEKLWKASEERKALLTHAAQSRETGDYVPEDIAARIDLNQTKRRALLLRAHDLAQSPRVSP